jgi:hypothetical protein
VPIGVGTPRRLTLDIDVTTGGCASIPWKILISVLIKICAVLALGVPASRRTAGAPLAQAKVPLRMQGRASAMEQPKLGCAWRRGPQAARPTV